jgi:hypothetical protein
MGCYLQNDCGDLSYKRKSARRAGERYFCNKIVASLLCAALRPQDGGNDYGLVVVVVVVSFFS